MARAYTEGANPSAVDEAPERKSGLMDDGDAAPASKKTGELLTLAPDKAAKRAVRLWESQDKIMSKRRAQWKANELRRRGVSNVQLVKKQDVNQWEVWVPLGASPDQTPSINQAAQICRKAASLMFADPPAPDPVPPSGDEDDIAASEFSQRVLIDLQGESQLDDVKKSRKAFDRASTYGSGFVRYYIDPKGERAPTQIQAGIDRMTGERATTVEDALQRAIPAEPDPLSGMAGEPVVEDWPEFEDRFVAEDGSLIDSERDAKPMWLPRVRSEVLTGKQVRFIPHTASDIWDAEAIQIASFLTWGALRKMFDLEVSEEERSHIFAYRPKHPEDLLGAGEKERLQPVADNHDETLVFVLTTYYRQCADYPNGAYVITIADKLAPVQEKWEAEVNGKVEPLDIPVTQYAQFDEGRDDPYKAGIMELIGAGNNIRGAMIGTLLDHLEKFNSRKIFLPVNSIINEKDLQLPQKTVIPMNPGGQPIYEELPSWPRDALEMFGLITAEQQNAVGLGEAAQGLDSANIESGRHALAAMAQAHAALSEIKQNIEAGYVRGCRIQLQLVRAFYDAPRQLKWEGEDGEYRHRSWTNADLGSTKDVRLKPGTLTMMMPAAKVALAERFLQAGSLTAAKFADIMASNVGGDIGLEDDPFRQRIKRQIGQWAEGPPDGWQPQPPVTVGPDGTPIDEQTAMMAAAEGIPVQQQPAPDPVLMEIWEPRLADELPEVASVRLMELAKLMSSRRYDRQPPEWRVPVDMEFQRMLGVAQQQMMQQQALPSGEQPQQKAAESADRNEEAAAEAVAAGAVA
jgi:hypothetical protein